MKTFRFLTLVACIAVLFFPLNTLADETVTATLEWAAVFDGSISNIDNMAALAVDGAGNVYVSGKSYPDVGDQYWLTVKYDKNLNEVWRARYRDSEVNYVKGIDVDSDGNVYITGEAKVSGTWSIGTIKYNASGVEQWVRTYNTGSDTRPVGIHVYEDTSDGGTYLYVPGRGSNNYITLKYDAANGAEYDEPIATAEYDGPASGSDTIYALTADDDGNVYVTGMSATEAGSVCATVKYNKALVQQWVSTSLVGPTAMVVDSDQNVYITGTNNKDYVTVKLNSSGVEQWAKSYDGPYEGTNHEDNSKAIAVDNAGNVYVTGDSVGLGTGRDYATIKYNASGEELWVKRYIGTGLGSGNSVPGEYARAIAVDGNGDVYVTGSRDSSSSPPTNNNDYATLKYAGTDGSLLYESMHGNDATREDAYEMALYTDSSDGKVYVFVAGDAGGELYSPGGYDYGVVKYDTADLTEENSIQSDELGSSASRASDLDVDSSGNVYVLGVTETAYGDVDYVTVKYDSNGAELWTSKHDSDAYLSSEPSEAIVVDADGNVYIAGTILVDYGNDWITVKYNADGEEQWATPYDGGHNDNAVDIGQYVDGDDGNVYIYVAGIIYDPDTTRSEYGVVKYNASGVEQWVRTFSYVGSGYDDVPAALAVDSDGNVYITGKSWTFSGYSAYVTVKYNKNGEHQWDKGYGYHDLDSPGATQRASHEARDIVVDADGNVYVTGTSYDGSSFDTSTGYDYATIKYDAEGNQLWVKRYNGEGKYSYVYDSYDVANAIAVDADGNVYITGESGIDLSTYHSYATVKYNASGVEQWVKRYSGASDTYADVATAISVDGFGRIYVTGKTLTGSYTSDYATIAYDGDGKELWAETHSGGDTSTMAYNSPSAILVKDDGHVYVTGQTFGIDTGQDCGTLKYSQSTDITDTEPPVVDGTSPVDDATGVLVTTLVTITFNEPMDASTITGPTFTLEETGTGTPVPGAVTYDEGTLTARFDPSADLSFGAGYTATVSDSVTDLAGNPLALTKWEFTTETEPDVEAPKVIGTTPENDAADVSITTTVIAAFDEAMDVTTIDALTFTVEETSSGNAIAGAVTYDAGFMEARFDLTELLSYDTEYTATLTTEITDLAGNPLEVEYSWAFTTNAEPDTTAPEVIFASLSPADQATGVSVSLESVRAQFNEPMSAGSINAGTVTVRNLDTGVAVTGQSVIYDAGTAQFVFDSNLSNATTYTVTISGQVMDLAGNAMGSDYTWSFRTAYPPPPPPPPDSSPPFVISVTPPNGFDRIPIDREIWDLGLLTATFNEAMDRTAIETIGTFTLEQDLSGVPVAVRVEYDSGAMTALCYPLTDLSVNTTYKATITRAARDAAGNAMAQTYEWRFSTGYDPTLPCYPEIGETSGCDNFDHFTYGTGAWVQRSYIGTTGPVGEEAHRARVTDGEGHAHKEYEDNEIECEAEAEVNGSTFSLKVRSQEKVVHGDLNDGGAFAASKVKVTGVPPHTAIPMSVIIHRNFRGSGAVELQIHDFEDREALGNLYITSRGVTSYGKRIDPFGPDTLDNYKSDYNTITPGMTRFDFLYPATPNNGVFLYFAGSASRVDGDTVSALTSGTVELLFNPPPGATVTLASGQTFVGPFDSDGDGVEDSEDDEPNNAMIATPATATGSGPVEVNISSTAGGGMSLSQVQTFSASDLFVNQTGKPTPATRTFPDGLVSFRLNGVGVDPVTVLLTFPTDIPSGAKYYKVDANGFYEFTNAQIFGNTVTLTLQDTGTRTGGDSSGAGGDGVIVDPGGIAFPANTDTSGDTGGGGGGGGCFIGSFQ